MDGSTNTELDWPPEQDNVVAQETTATSRDTEEDDHRLQELPTPKPKTLLGGRLKLRADDDDAPSDWWFASTAIPLLCATFAPFANLLSIAALVVYWRNRVTTDDPADKYSTSVGYEDPPWALVLNGASLAIGFLANIFLVCNFTKKIRYLITLPVTIFLHYVASGILIRITIAMNVYDPPQANEVYSQAY